MSKGGPAAPQEPSRNSTLNFTYSILASELHGEQTKTQDIKADDEPSQESVSWLLGPQA